ncbi:hypothetical protein LR48_Vigan03g073500 [Vigna angularis]|uniref:Uncharacterized protein n=1 Tax=Phaseolus angularis TaxID=3914 RepID=A0A0L9U4M7_PHAAN|nr:hypothetical protein LR48_Vigan03g073500 [Vigna angularis]
MNLTSIEKDYSTGCGNFHSTVVELSVLQLHLEATSTCNSTGCETVHSLVVELSGFILVKMKTLNPSSLHETLARKLGFCINLGQETVGGVLSSDLCDDVVGGSIRVESWWDEGLVVGGGFVVRRCWREEATVLRKGSLARSARWRFGVGLDLDE